MLSSSLGSKSPQLICQFLHHSLVSTPPIFQPPIEVLQTLASLPPIQLVALASLLKHCLSWQQAAEFQHCEEMYLASAGLGKQLL